MATTEKEAVTIEHKPIIETIINTCALALTAWGVAQITTAGTWECITKGSLMILFGAGLEFFKYYGRSKEYW